MTIRTTFISAASATKNAVNSQLFTLRSANMNSTADQSFAKQGSFTRYQITSIVAIVKTGAPTASVGGIYTAAAKGGTAIVTAAHAYTALSAVDKVLNLTLASLTDVLQATPIFSLTTANGAAATADIFIYGNVLD